MQTPCQHVGEAASGPSAVCPWYGPLAGDAEAVNRIMRSDRRLPFLHVLKIQFLNCPLYITMYEGSIPAMETANPLKRTQLNQNLQKLTEDEAREFIERIRWPHGPVCPHCGSISVYRMAGQTIRPGLLACRDCRGHFTVMVGTIMEDSRLSLAMWIRAFHLMTSNKKGMSALRLKSNLGLGSYQTAWHLAHRIREAMRCEPLAELLNGSVRRDENF